MKKNFVSAGIIFLLAIMVGCNTATSPEIGGENGTVTGEIKIDGKTNDVFGRQILVLGTSYFASIDESGKYVISDIPAKTDYTLCFVSDSYRYIVKRNVEVKAKETTNIEEVNISSSEWKEYKFTWLGEKDNAPENAQKNQAYYNKQDGCSYIYNGSGWELLVKGGADGKDGVNGTDGAVGAENYVEVTPTDRGIKFTAKILSNVSDYTSASVTFEITEKESGITLTRDWAKSSGDTWKNCDMYYPFVNNGKKYTFELTAYSGSYTLYKGDFMATATGGLGEFKIENADTYTTELTAEKVVKRTGRPIYTKNSNVKILKEGYDFWLANGRHEWIWGDNAYFGENRAINYGGGTFDGEFDLTKLADWKPFWKIDASLKGDQYFIHSRTRLAVVGYTDNGQTYFRMNDNTEIKGDWGSEKEKVYIMFGFGDDPDDPRADVYNLPGEPTTFVVSGENETNYITYNCMVVDYNQSVLEPANNTPLYENYPNLKFDSWYTMDLSGQHATRTTFPLTAEPVSLGNQFIKTEDGKEVKYVMWLVPSFSLNATIKGTVVETGKEIVVSNMTIGTINENSSQSYRVYDGNRYHSFSGLYYDEDCEQWIGTITNLKNYDKENNSIVLYTKEHISDLKCRVKAMINESEVVESIFYIYYKEDGKYYYDGYKYQYLYYDKDCNNRFYFSSINLKNLERDTDGTIILWTQASQNSPETAE